MHEVPITKDVTLIVREFCSTGAWINFAITNNGKTYYTDPWCWTTSCELSEEGLLKDFKWNNRITKVVEKLFATLKGGQSEEFVKEAIYREIAALMSIRETMYAEYVGTKRVAHKGQKWLLEHILTVIPEWTKWGSKPHALVQDRHFPPHPKFKDEESFSHWLGNHYGRHSKGVLKGYDIFGVGKKRIGMHLYKAIDGTAIPAQVLHAGWAKGVPVGRHTRELGGFKHAERLPFSYDVIEPYFTTTDERFVLPQEIRKYLTRVRVGIVFTHNDTMDMMKITPAGLKYFQCVLTRRERIHDAEVKPGYKHIKSNSRTKCVLLNERMKVHDEKTQGLHTCKLILPGGVKGIAEVIDTDIFDEQGRPIHLLIDYVSICRKGAMALLAMLTDEPIAMTPLTDVDAIPRMEERIAQLKKQRIATKDGKTAYVGFAGELDYIYRAGERPTEQNKLTATPTDIFVDAMKGHLPRSTPEMEEEFSKFKQLDETLHSIIEKLGHLA